jgi:long-chain acyl-CoA synthetase
MVKAYIVRCPGATLEAQELIAFCRARMAAFKTPTFVEFRENLPKSAVGKVLRRVLLDEERARAPQS